MYKQTLFLLELSYTFVTVAVEVVLDVAAVLVAAEVVEVVEVARSMRLVSSIILTCASDFAGPFGGSIGHRLLGIVHV